MGETGLSARAQLVKTRRGTWVDETLFPAARRECLEVIERVARDSRDNGIVEMLRGHTKRLGDYPLGDRLRELGIASSDFDWVSSSRLNWGALMLLAEKLREYELPEERDAWRLAAIEAPKFARTCGSCARSLRPGEPAYFGAEVYVGFPPLRWNMVDRLRVCQPHHQRTVLCGSCAPQWLSADIEGVVTQLCGQCERPMVSRLTPSEMGRTFCSEPCGRAYRSQLRKERRAEEREKVCEVCGREFTATRKDAKTCSSGCKQKAYRRRRRETKQDR